MYDIIGDIHGCYDEWMTLIDQLGYNIDPNGLPTHPDGRKMILVGDLTDRGPDSLKVVRKACDWFQKDAILYIPGNHCNKLYRYMLGRPVQIKHGLETTVEELEHLTPEDQSVITRKFMTLYEKAPLYLVLDKGRLVVTHAGIRQKDIGHSSERIKSFVLYGDTTGKKDEHGRPERRDWAKHYHGGPWIIYGHTPVKSPRIIHHTANIDTGCVFGGTLTAFRYPELATISVPSNQPYQPDRFKDFDLADQHHKADAYHPEVAREISDPPM